MGWHDESHPPTDSHVHADGMPGVRLTGWRHDTMKASHQHSPSSSWMQRIGEKVMVREGEGVGMTTIQLVGGGTLIIAGDPAIVRTLPVYVDGELVHPCQFGSHRGIKYNVVQLHHKDPVGLGGPPERLDYDEDCGWPSTSPGLGACGLHHDDTHMLWRLMSKALAPDQPWTMPVGLRNQFGSYVIRAVAQGWKLRRKRLQKGDSGGTI